MIANRDRVFWSWFSPAEELVIHVCHFSYTPRFCCFLVWFGWFLNVLVNYLVISRTGPKTERLTVLRAATHETELGDHNFCLSRSYYTDTDPTSREPPVTAGFEPGTSSPGVARSTDWATAPPPVLLDIKQSLQWQRDSSFCNGFDKSLPCDQTDRRM